MKVRITNKTDIIKNIQGYFKNEEAGEDDELHFCFQHSEDRDRVLEREVSENEVIEVFGYLDNDGETSMQETDDIFTYIDIEENFMKYPAMIKAKIEKLETEDLPYDIESYIQYFEAKGEEFEANCNSFSS